MSNESEGLDATLQPDVQPVAEMPAPSEEIATSGPRSDRDIAGRFARGNQAGLVSGIRSRQIENALAPARHAIAAQITADLGGSATDTLPATLARLVRRSVRQRSSGRVCSRG